jgi:hypothetical protein
MTLLLSRLSPALSCRGKRCRAKNGGLDMVFPDFSTRPKAKMRLILRVIGTWLLGIALILVVIDGTRSLAANALVLTPLADFWTMLNPPSLAAVHGFAESRLFGAVLVPALDAVLNYPGFAVIGVPGIVLAVLGRTRRARRYIRTDEF